MSPRAGLLTLIGIATILGLAACSDQVTDPQVTADSLEAKLFTLMNHDDFDSAGDIVGRLYEYRNANPLNYRTTFLLGGASMWFLGESARPGPVNPLLIMEQTIPLILDSFVDVIQHDSANAPDAKDLLGAFLYQTGFDKQGGAGLVDQAGAVIPEAGAEQAMLIRMNEPADDPATEEAVRSGFKFWELCSGAAVDTTNPDFTGRVQPPTDAKSKGFCWGSPRVPHGFEGAWLIFGDILVKSGRLNAGHRAYLNAQLGVNYDSWKYKDVIEERLQEDLAARHATYASNDPTQWAAIGVPPFVCTQCHASKF